MINILFPVNKSVGPEFKYYALFLNRLSDQLVGLNIKVTFLLFSKNLMNKVKSKIVILGENSSEKNKSIGELENEYEFSFREILFTDLLQTSEFITKTRGRNWYIPDMEFMEKETYRNKMNHIVDIVENNEYSFVFSDQTTDYEFNFLKYVCLKNNVPYIRYIANFMNRGNFIIYDNSGGVKSLDVEISYLEKSKIIEFLNNYREGKNASIYNMKESNLKQFELQKTPLWKRIIKKNPRTYQSSVEHRLKDSYINGIEKLLKSFYYDIYEKDSKYIYYGLHLTTESHVALNSYPFINQINVIELISRALPFGYQLYVKLHPWWNNRISLSVIKQIKKIPSVKIIHHKHSIKEIVKNSAGLITLNATTGIEALALGKPLIALATVNSFTEHHPNARLCTDMYKLPRMISNMVREEVSEDATLEYFSKKFRYTSDLRLEADRVLSEEDAQKKAIQFSNHIEKVINL